MRTTIELPDDLLRRVKATSALKGMKLKDLVAQMLENALRNQAPELDLAPKPIRELPVMIPATGRKIPNLTNSELFQILDQEDDELHARLS